MKTLEENWFSKCLRQVHLDCHMPSFPREALKNFDAERFVAHLVRGKLNEVTVFAKCHFGNSFYFTDVGHRHPGLRRNFLMEVAEECHSNGIRVLAYYSLCWDKHAGDENPDWMEVNAEGKRIGADGPWGWLCLNSPYREELVLPQLEEVAKDYPVDGLWLDIPWMHMDSCFCEYCKRKFEEIKGGSLTPETPAEIRRRFVQRATIELVKEAKDIFKRHKPDAIIGANTGWELNRPREFSDLLDFGCWESQPRFGRYDYHSLKARYTRNLGRPVQIMTVRFVQGWGDLTLKPVEQMKYELASIMANGGLPSGGDQIRVDGTLEPEAYDFYREIFSFVEEREEFCIGSESIPYIAVIVPNESPNSMLSETLRWLYGSRPAAALTGAHKTLVEKHLQYDLIDEYALSDLGKYSIVVLPDIPGLQDNTLTAIESFVKDGGHLLATGKANLTDPDRFSLRNVLGVEYIGPTPYKLSHFQLGEELTGPWLTMPLQVRGPSHKVRPIAAKTMAKLRYPVTAYAPPTRAFRSPWSPPGRESGFPAITLNEFGRGRAAYIAAPIFEIFWNTNHAWLKEIVANTLKVLGPEPPFLVEGPPTLEANLMQRQGELLLHLVNFHSNAHASSESYPPIECIPPLFDIQVGVKAKKPKAVYLEPGAEKLDFQAEGRYVHVRVPKVHIHQIVRIVVS